MGNMDQDYSNDEIKQYNLLKNAIESGYFGTATATATPSQIQPNQSSAMMVPQYDGTTPNQRQPQTSKGPAPFNMNASQYYNLSSTPAPYPQFNTDTVDYSNMKSSPAQVSRGLTGYLPSLIPQSFIDYKTPPPASQLQHQPSYFGQMNQMISPLLKSQQLQQQPYAKSPLLQQPVFNATTPLDLYSSPQEFPESFDPRNAANMPHKEKVNNWIKQVPIYYLNNGPIIDYYGNQQWWHNDCYPGAVPSSSDYSEDDDDIDEDLEVFYDNDGYRSGGPSPFGSLNYLFVDHEDVLEFQARKITKYVKKIYQNDPNENIVKGEDISLKQSETKTNNKDNSCLVDMDSNIDITNTSYKLNLTEAIEQINTKRYWDDLDDLIINNGDEVFEKGIKDK